MTKASRLTSSFSLFGSGKFSDTIDDDSVTSNASSKSTRLRIRRKKRDGKYSKDNHDEMSVGTINSHRIGIVRPNYEVSDDYLAPFPKSPLILVKTEDTDENEETFLYEEDQVEINEKNDIFRPNYKNDDVQTLSTNKNSSSKNDKKNSDEMTEASESHRIGIVRSNYSVSSDMILDFSPLHLKKQEKENSSDQKMRVKYTENNNRISTKRNYEEVREDEIPLLSPISMKDLSPISMKDLSPISMKDGTGTSPTPNLVEVDSSQSEGETRSRTSNEMKLECCNSEQNSFTASEEDSPCDDDEVDRIIHEQTAKGHYLVSSPRLDCPVEGMKYSLQTGKKSMTSSMRRSSRIIKTRPNTILKNESSFRLSAVTFKIFILLIQPQSKIFEIIQVLYSPSTTTVGNLLEMIPENATEPALGSQKYVGLCRPKNGEEISVDMMASASPSEETTSARITRGEILVAIPTGPYDSLICAKIAKPLLLNPRVTKLLNRSDPLAPKRDKKKTRKSSSVRKHLAPFIETVPEESCSFDDESTGASTTGKREREIAASKERDMVQKALQNAAEAAATSNAEIICDHNNSTPSFPVQDISTDMWKSNMNHLRSRSMLRRGTSTGDSSSTIISQESFDSGVPFDTSVVSTTMDDSLSLSASCCTDNQYGLKRIPRRRTRRPRSATKKRYTSFQFLMTSAFVLAIMIVRYIMVSSGQHKESTSVSSRETVSSSFSSVLEMAQVVFAFYLFCKWQKFLKGEEDPMKHPVCRIIKKGWKRIRLYAAYKEYDREQ